MSSVIVSIIVLFGEAPNDIEISTYKSWFILCTTNLNHLSKKRLFKLILGGSCMATYTWAFLARTRPAHGYRKVDKGMNFQPTKPI
jgi:hypothetical protein